MPARSMVRSPHGSPTERTSDPSPSFTSTRSTMSIPMVIMATANTGFPTIGRMAKRSITRPVTAVSSIASGRASQN